MFNVRWRDRIFQVAGSVKALLAILLTVGLAAADYWDAIPMQAALQQVLGDNAATKLAFWLPIVFGTLRYVSTNQVKWQHKPGADGEPF